MTKEERRTLIKRTTWATKVNEKAVRRKTGGGGGTGNGSKRPWTQAEDRVLMRTDIPVAEMCRLTGRTYQAIVARRSQEPKFKNVIDRHLKHRTR